MSSPSSPLRIVFAGTPVFAAESLRALLHTQHEVVAVYTQPDRPVGRGRKLEIGPVKELALSRRLPVYQPISLRDSSAQAELAALQPDLMVVAAYGLILPRAVLEIPRLGCINVHASLLPRWRGAAPIQRAILADDSETGITIMQMDEGLDTGAMLCRMPCPISDHDTAASLHDRLALLGGDALLSVIDTLEQGDPLHPEAQDNSLATYAAKLSKDEAVINWQQPATAIARAVRAYNPWPIASTRLQEQTLRIWQVHAATEETTAPAGMIIRADRQGLAVACGEGSVLIIDTLQLPNGKALPFADLVNGHAATFRPGTMFGS